MGTLAGELGIGLVGDAKGIGQGAGNRVWHVGRDGGRHAGAGWHNGVPQRGFREALGGCRSCREAGRQGRGD